MNSKKVLYKGAVWRAQSKQTKLKLNNLFYLCRVWNFQLAGGPEPFLRFIIIYLFYEGVGSWLTQITRRFTQLIFLGHIYTSKLSWDRVLSFFSFEFII